MEPSNQDRQAFIDPALVAKSLKLSKAQRLRLVNLISAEPAGIRSDGSMPFAAVIKLACIAQGVK
jgi:hypothetical protein